MLAYPAPQSAMVPPAVGYPAPGMPSTMAPWPPLPGAGSYPPGAPYPPTATAADPAALHHHAMMIMMHQQQLQQQHSAFQAFHQQQQQQPPWGAYPGAYPAAANCTAAAYPAAPSYTFGYQAGVPPPQAAYATQPPHGYPMPPHTTAAYPPPMPQPYLPPVAPPHAYPAAGVVPSSVATAGPYFATPPPVPQAAPASYPAAAPAYPAMSPPEVHQYQFQQWLNSQYAASPQQQQQQHHLPHSMMPPVSPQCQLGHDTAASDSEPAKASTSMTPTTTATANLLRSFASSPGYARTPTGDYAPAGPHHGSISSGGGGGGGNTSSNANGSGSGSGNDGRGSSSKDGSNSGGTPTEDHGTDSGEPRRRSTGAAGMDKHRHIAPTDDSGHTPPSPSDESPAINSKGSIGTKADFAAAGARHLVVKFLTAETSESELKRLFSKYGVVEQARVIRDRVTGNPKGYGFVDYVDPSDAATAVKKMRGYPLCGKRLKVAFVAGDRQSPSTGGTGDSPALLTQPKPQRLSDLPCPDPANLDAAHHHDHRGGAARWQSQSDDFGFQREGGIGEASASLPAMMSPRRLEGTQTHHHGGTHRRGPSSTCSTPSSRRTTSGSDSDDDALIAEALQTHRHHRQ